MADIIIHGMEMPACGFQGWIEFSGDGIFRILDVREEEVAEEHEYIELPPHGRLIDADELKKKHHWTDDFYETEYVEVEDIDAAPTIIPAARKDE